jgi:predicted MFS family arabinose efflux permease
MLTVLRQRNFGLLWTGGLISMIGDWILFVGLPFEIYRLTGSTLATGGMVLAALLPRIVLGSVAGVYVDRWDRRRLMIVVNVLLAVFLLPLLAIGAIGLWVAFLVLVIESSLEQLFMPAEMALLPNLLEGGQEELVTANALSGVNRHLARLVGPAIGGVVVALGGLTAVAIVDAASFLVAAALIFAIRTTRSRAERIESVEHETVTAWQRLLGEWRDGLRVVGHDLVLRAVLVFLVITAIGEGLTLTLFVPWVRDALHSDSAGYGAVLSTQAIGGLFGALVIGRLGPRINPLRMLIVASLIFGLIDLVLFTYPVVYPHIGPALVMLVIVGVPGAAIGAGVATLEQIRAEDRQRGRVIGAIGALGAVGSLVGAVLAGFAGEVVPVVALLVVQGSGYVIGGLVVAFMTRSMTTALPVPAAETEVTAP